MSHQSPATATEPAADAVLIHETQFHRNRFTGLYRGMCSCGWMRFGTLEECQKQAAVHDIAWEAVDVAAPAPAVTA